MNFEVVQLLEDAVTVDFAEMLGGKQLEIHVDGNGMVKAVLPRSTFIATIWNRFPDGHGMDL